MNTVHFAGIWFGQIKKISVFQVTGLKILGRGRHTYFFNYFFPDNKYNYVHFERRFSLSKCIKLYIFQKT